MIPKLAFEDKHDQPGSVVPTEKSKIPKNIQVEIDALLDEIEKTQAQFREKNASPKALMMIAAASKSRSNARNQVETATRLQRSKLRHLKDIQAKLLHPEECSFHPKVNPLPKFYSRSLRTEDGGFLERSDRLVEVNKRKMDQIVHHVRTKELEECTFHPTTTDYPTARARVWDESQIQKDKFDFNKNIERIREMNVKREFAQCTFAPKITAKSRKIAKQVRENPYFQVRTNHKAMMESKRECTFKPKVNTVPKNTSKKIEEYIEKDPFERLYSTAAPFNPAGTQPKQTPTAEEITNAAYGETYKVAEAAFKNASKGSKIDKIRIKNFMKRVQYDLKKRDIKREEVAKQLEIQGKPELCKVSMEIMKHKGLNFEERVRTNLSAKEAFDNKARKDFQRAYSFNPKINKKSNMLAKNAIRDENGNIIIEHKFREKAEDLKFQPEIRKSTFRRLQPYLSQNWSVRLSTGESPTIRTKKRLAQIQVEEKKRKLEQQLESYTTSRANSAPITPQSKQSKESLEKRRKSRRQRLQRLTRPTVSMILSRSKQKQQSSDQSDISTPRKAMKIGKNKDSKKVENSVKNLVINKSPPSRPSEAWKREKKTKFTFSSRDSKKKFSRQNLEQSSPRKIEEEEIDFDMTQTEMKELLKLGLEDVKLSDLSNSD
eukprot:TRINITY_DN73_c0_g1_i4.p1 TRINITY_DN73_c0_g1~~TRINITY_DN73_c0_g1_i4.p1  ORF type:complete len:660 (+),score=143.75 TRINITY_DN73_c0_g1_i4:58-2037(+)